MIIPNPLEMHRADLDDLAVLLTFENPVPAAPGHPRNIQQFRSVDFVVVYYVSKIVTAKSAKPTLSPCNAYAACFNLIAKAAFVFPQSGCHPRFGPRRLLLPR